jgi:uroporphyrinogen-III synthase
LSRRGSSSGAEGSGGGAEVAPPLPVLHGLRVAVTRPGGPGDRISEGLRDLGASVLPVPVGRFVPPADGPALLRAAAGLDGFDWVVLTSPNGVAALAEALGELGGGGFPASPPPRLCAVGPGTGERCEELLGRSPDLVPSASVGEGIVQRFSEMAQEGGLGGGRVLLLQGDAARRVVLEGLRGLGFLVTGVVAYRNLPDREALPAFVADVQGGGVDLLVLTAGSAARRVGMALREGGVDAFPPVVCMGPAASGVAEEEGFPVVGVAHPHTAEGVVQACARFWGGDGGAVRR